MVTRSSKFWGPESPVGIETHDLLLRISDCSDHPFSPRFMMVDLLILIPNLSILSNLRLVFCTTHIATAPYLPVLQTLPVLVTHLFTQGWKVRHCWSPQGSLFLHYFKRMFKSNYSLSMMLALGSSLFPFYEIDIPNYLLSRTGTVLLIMLFCMYWKKHAILTLWFLI